MLITVKFGRTNQKQSIKMDYALFLTYIRKTVPDDSRKYQLQNQNFLKLTDKSFK